MKRILLLTSVFLLLVLGVFMYTAVVNKYPPEVQSKMDFFASHQQEFEDSLEGPEGTKTFCLMPYKFRSPTADDNDDCALTEWNSTQKFEGLLDEYHSALLEIHTAKMPDATKIAAFVWYNKRFKILSAEHETMEKLARQHFAVLNKTKP